MPSVTVTEHIDVPVEEVFAYLTDPVNELAWVSSAREREIVADEGGKGTRFRAVEQWLARKIEFLWEITEWDAPHRYAMRTIDGPFQADIDITLAPEDNGTKLTYAAGAEAGLRGFFGKLTEPLVTRIFERDTKTDLAKLKDLLETEGGTA